MEEVLGAKKTAVISLHRQEVFVNLTEVAANAMFQVAPKMHIRIDCVDLTGAVSGAILSIARSGHSGRDFAALIPSVLNEAEIMNCRIEIRIYHFSSNRATHARIIVNSDIIASEE